jgi:hypothetical protein
VVRRFGAHSGSDSRLKYESEPSGLFLVCLREIETKQDYPSASIMSWRKIDNMVENALPVVRNRLAAIWKVSCSSTLGFIVLCDRVENARGD